MKKFISIPPQPSLFRKLQKKIRYKVKLLRCRRAVARAAARMEREKDCEDCVIWVESKNEHII